MVLLWRLGLGGTMAGRRRGYVMVLVTTGRKSGQRRLAPLNFAEDPGYIYCLAGFGRRTHWLANLLADPHCEIWLPDGRRLSGNAELVTDEATRIELIRRLLVRAGFATKLAEPGLDPILAPEAEIAQLGGRYGRRYEAVRISITGSVGGPGGPGDLRWVLPVAALGAAATLFVLRRIR
jgi:deazaflavin-dependent oxidoreductase (nitroreductase family)